MHNFPATSLQKVKQSQRDHREARSGQLSYSSSTSIPDEVINTAKISLPFTVTFLVLTSPRRYNPLSVPLNSSWGQRSFCRANRKCSTMLFVRGRGLLFIVTNNYLVSCNYQASKQNNLAAYLMPKHTRSYFSQGGQLVFLLLQTHSL